MQSYWRVQFIETELYILQFLHDVESGQHELWPFRLQGLHLRARKNSRSTKPVARYAIYILMENQWNKTLPWNKSPGHCPWSAAIGTADGKESIKMRQHITGSAQNWISSALTVVAFGQTCEKAWTHTLLCVQRERYHVRNANGQWYGKHYRTTRQKTVPTQSWNVRWAVVNHSQGMLIIKRLTWKQTKRHLKTAITSRKRSTLQSD